MCIIFAFIPAIIVTFSLLMLLSIILVLSSLCDKKIAALTSPILLKITEFRARILVQQFNVKASLSDKQKQFTNRLYEVKNNLDKHLLNYSRSTELIIAVIFFQETP